MYGAQTKYGVARQSAAGTAVTQVNSFRGFGFTSEDVGLEKDELISQNLIGRFEEGAVYDGAARINGTIEAELTPKSLIALCGAVMTHLPSTVNSGSLRTWGFLPNTQDFSSTLVKAPFTIYKQFSDATSAELYYDCQFGQIDFQFGQGQFLRGRVAVAGGTRQSAGVGSMAVSADVTDAGRLFPWNVSSITLAGTALDSASEITVSLNENIEALYTINGTLTPFKYTRTAFRQVTVNGTFYMADRALLNAFDAGTLQRLLITAINTRTAIQSGYFDTLLIDVPQLKVTAFKPGVSGPGEVSVSFTGRGTIDPSSNYALKVTLTNTSQVDL